MTRLTLDDVRYCTTSDGVRIAYAVQGEGVPILECQGVINSFFDELARAEDSKVRRRGPAGRQIIRYDMRGTGLSQRDVADLSHDALLLDMEAVVEALGLRKFVLMATTMSGPRVIAFAAKHPDLLHALILHGTTARFASVWPVQVIEALCGLARSNWPQAAQAMAGLNDATDRPEAVSELGEMYVRSADGETVAALFEGSYPIDVRPLLPFITSPTLVLHITGDEVMPFIEGQKIAAAIPGAELVALDHPTRGVGVTYEAEVTEAIERFLDRFVPTASVGD